MLLWGAHSPSTLFALVAMLSQCLCSENSYLLVKLYRMLHEYQVIYSVRYCSRFHVTAVLLGMYYPRIQGHYCTSIINKTLKPLSVSWHANFIRQLLHEHYRMVVNYVYRVELSTTRLKLHLKMNMLLGNKAMPAGNMWLTVWMSLLPPSAGIIWWEMWLHYIRKTSHRQ
jgi:hypothetical protein